MSSPYWYEYNANPFKQDINDCAIRAVTLGLGIRYEEVCKFFGRKFRKGLGLIGKEGIKLPDIQRKFGPFFADIENVWDTWYEKRPEEFEDFEFDPLIDGNATMGMSLNDFCEIYDGTGKYLVALIPGGTSLDKTGHIIYANLGKRGKPLFYDTKDCGDLQLLSFMRIKTKWPSTNPKSLYYKGTEKAS